MHGAHQDTSAWTCSAGRCGELFEGVCLNSRHPGPRRVWKGGSEQQSMTPDPGDPGMNSKSCKNRVFLQQK